jgi:hypothetical protein
VGGHAVASAVAKSTESPISAWFGLIVMDLVVAIALTWAAAVSTTTSKHRLSSILSVASRVAIFGQTSP